MQVGGRMFISHLMKQNNSDNRISDIYHSDTCDCFVQNPTSYELENECGMYASPKIGLEEVEDFNEYQNDGDLESSFHNFTSAECYGDIIDQKFKKCIERNKFRDSQVPPQYRYPTVGDRIKRKKMVSDHQINLDQKKDQDNQYSSTKCNANELHKKNHSLKNLDCSQILPQTDNLENYQKQEKHFVSRQTELSSSNGLVNRYLCLCLAVKNWIIKNLLEQASIFTFTSKQKLNTFVEQNRLNEDILDTVANQLNNELDATLFKKKQKNNKVKYGIRFCAMFEHQEQIASYLQCCDLIVFELQNFFLRIVHQVLMEGDKGLSQQVNKFVQKRMNPLFLVLTR